MTLDPPTNGAARTSAADRTEPMFPALATTDTPRDVPAEVHKLLLAGGSLTREQLHDELGEPRVPLGILSAALDELGATVDSNGRWSLRSTEDAEAVMRRRADVLEAMFDLARAKGTVTAQIVADFIEGGDLVDVINDAMEVLVDVGMLYRSGSDDSWTYDLTDSIYDKIIRLGAEAVARATVPELARSIVDRTEFERVAAEKLDAEHKAHVETARQFRQLSTFLHDNGQDVASILSPPEPVTPGPKRDEFMWEQQVSWTDAVELELRRKDAALRAKLALSEASLDSEKARHGGLRKGVEEELREIATAIADRVYVQRERAYREPRWSEGVTLVVRVADGVILDEQPIAKGTQRAIDVSPKAASVPPGDAADQAAADADATKAAEAAAIKGSGPRGELTMERVLGEAEALLRGFGSAGIEWGDSGNEAVRVIARTAHTSEKGALPQELKRLARAALNRLLANGRAVRCGDAVCWAELVDTSVAQAIDGAAP